MRHLKTITIACSLLFLSGCAKEELLPADFIKWTKNEQNGLRPTQFTSNFKYELQYKPYNYLVSVEGRSNELSQKRVSERQKELDGFQYYTLKIESNDGQEIMVSRIENQDEHDFRLNYCTSVIKNDLFLLTGSDTIPCSVCHLSAIMAWRHTTIL